MYAASVLLYPAVLALLCLGAGLLVDRLSAGFLPASLLLAVGLASLIGLSQLVTYVPGLAPAAPEALAAFAAAGLVLGRRRLRPLAGRLAACPWPAAVSLAAYLVALAPVLLAGRASFSSFMALSDSAVHMIGADYLIAHGQSYTHLDPRTSYGLFIHDYYASSYPSGADTLLGASARIPGLQMIWAFQPLCAFVLASAAGPAWLIARRTGLRGPWAAAASLSAVVPALVYAYELIGSVKELASLPMILTLGALVVVRSAWLGRSPRRAIPFGLVCAAGVSALGVAFGVWALVAALVLAAGALAGAGSDIRRARAIALGALTAAGAMLLAAWPTWSGLSGSVTVASSIASTGNAGNLHSPLRAEQVLGIWIGGSYKLAPTGSSWTLTRLLELLVLGLVIAGAANMARRRAWGLLAWSALMILAWVLVTHSVTTWGAAKTLMLTSPAVVLLAWAGVAALEAARGSRVARWAGAAAALALLAGVLASDLMQYRSSDLAPTARYREMEAIEARFAGRGPAVFTDFDEYSMYVLRGVGVAGPDFVYQPPAVAAAAPGYGRQVQLGKIPPRSLLGYPLIITRRDPAAERPPAAYALLWRGSYYEVWGRGARAAASLAHLTLSGSRAARCAAVGRLAAADPHGRLAAPAAAEIATAGLRSAALPAGWGREHTEIVMGRPGTLRLTLVLPRAGAWRLWLKGRFMPPVEVSVDGRGVERLAGELSGNSIVTAPAPPRTLDLSAGAHTVTVARLSGGLSPGDRGTAVLNAVYLSSVASGEGDGLTVVPAARWRALCPAAHAWVEALPG